MAVATRRNWVPYWTVLRGPMLLFFASEEAAEEEASPHHSVSLEGCLVQPIYDNIKRHHLFELTACSGSVMQLETTSAEDVDGWIREIHLAAAVLEVGMEMMMGCFCLLFSSTRNSNPATAA